MNMHDLAYCNECDDLVEFTTSIEYIEEVFHDVKIKYKFNVGRCKICRSEVATDIGYNYRKSDAKWEAYNKLKEAKDE